MKAETKWAIIAALGVLVWMVLCKALGWHSAEKFETGMYGGLIFSVAWLVFIYLMVCREKRDQEYNGVMSWSEGFWTCARVTLIFIPLSSALFYLYMKSIHPEFCDVVAAKMAESGSITGKDPLSDSLYSHVLMTYLCGGLFSLLAPVIFKRNPA